MALLETRDFWVRFTLVGGREVADGAGPITMENMELRGGGAQSFEDVERGVRVTGDRDGGGIRGKKLI